MTGASPGLQPEPWDALIVGAGVTGSTLACLLARSGRRTLLVDRAAFPREKVCGGCLSPASVALIQELGLEAALLAASPRPLRQVRLRLRNAAVAVPHGGVVVSRASLDASLAAHAVRSGAVFFDQTAATLGPLLAGSRQVELRCGPTRQLLRARLVFVCDGLGGRLLEAEPAMAWRISPFSRLGVHMLLKATDLSALKLPDDSLLMCVGRGGYVGLVRLSDGRIDLAAALAPARCRALGGPGPVIADILRQCGQRLAFPDAPLHGTPLLTRRRRLLGKDRVLALGDAAGYIEPFTGEGMKWGIASAAGIAQLCAGGGGGGGRGAGEVREDLWDNDLPRRWRTLHDEMLVGPMRRCRLLSWALRCPGLIQAGLGAARLLPAVAGRLADAVNAPLKLPVAANVG